MANPPFNRPADEIGRMSDDQVLGFFDHERNEEDLSPKLSLPTGRTPTSRSLHNRWCFELGITEPDDIERLWREKQARKREAASKKKGRTRGQPDR